jgi:phenylalanyl-tRNA synthetase beta chain
MRDVDTSVDYINKSVGIDLDAQSMVKLLGRMSLPATHLSNREIRVKVPCTRSDILHPCDIMEDVAIGYGFNNIKAVLPQTLTGGKQQTVNKFSDLLRHEVAQAGYNEVLTLVLVNLNELFIYFLLNFFFFSLFLLLSALGRKISIS